MGRKKQQEIPGTERPDRIAAIEDANESLREIKSQIRALADKKAAAKVKVIQEMNNHNVTEYRYRSDDGVGRKVALVGDTKVKQTKVRTTSDHEDGEEAGADEGGAS